MIRVLFLTHIGQPSGGEIALVRLIRALQTQQIQAFVITGEEGPLISQLRDVGAHVEVMRLDARISSTRKDAIVGPLAQLKNVAAIATYSRKISQRIADLDIQIVHANSLKSGFYGGIAAKMAKVPFVWHLRDRLSRDYLPVFAIALVKVAMTMLATRVVCNSTSTLQTLTAAPFGFLAVRARAVSSPLRDVFDSTRLLHVHRVAEAGTPLRYVLVGRIAPWKGQDLAMSAFEKAKTGSSTLDIVGSAMFGEHQYQEKLQQCLRVSPLKKRIRLAGFVPDIADKLQRYDVLIHSSRTPEPFGQVVIEGLASGLAVIAANAGGPAEIIASDQNGLLFTPGDEGSLARAIERIYEDPQLRRRLGAAGMNRATDYLPAAIAQETYDLYRACLIRAGRSRQTRQ